MTRLIDALADSFEPCKMNNRINLVLVKNCIKNSTITNISLIKQRGNTSDMLNPIKGNTPGIRKIINHNALITRFDKLDERMRADIASTTRHENSTQHYAFTASKN